MLPLTHKNVHGAASKVLPAEIPQTGSGTGHMPRNLGAGGGVKKGKKKLDHFIRLAWRRCIITHVTLHAPAAVLVAVSVLGGST